MVQQAEHKKHAQGQAEVDEGLHIFGQQKQVLGHIDLGEDAGIAHQGGHTLAGGLIEAGENQVSAKQVGGVVVHATAKKLGKDQAHHQQHHQRREHTPGHAQHRALVFLHEIPLYQLLEEELVAFQLLYHSNSPT